MIHTSPLRGAELLGHGSPLASHVCASYTDCISKDEKWKGLPEASGARLWCLHTPGPRHARRQGPDPPVLTQRALRSHQPLPMLGAPRSQAVLCIFMRAAWDSAGNRTLCSACVSPSLPLTSFPAPENSVCLAGGSAQKQWVKMMSF
jgi:hypothetical protein